MFQFNSAVIQVEFGENAKNYFAPRDTRDLLDILFGAQPPQWADDLMAQTDSLCEQLKQDGISVPCVLLIDAPEMPPDIFRITCGIGGRDFDYRQYSYSAAFEETVRELHVPDLTRDTIEKGIQETLEMIWQKKFQDAMQKLFLIYYQSVLIEYPPAQVFSLLNIAGINLLNKQINSAYTAARQALGVVESDSFFDPYLRFYTHTAIANILALNGHYDDGAEYFERAFQDICAVNEENYTIETLYNRAVALLLAEDYQKCTEVLDTAVTYIEHSGKEHSKLLITLYRIRGLTADLAIDQLQSKLAVVQQQYDKLAQSLFVKTREMIFTILSKCGSYLLASYAGSLKSANVTFDNSINQTTEQGDNIVCRKVEVLE